MIQQTMVSMVTPDYILVSSACSHILSYTIYGKTFAVREENGSKLLRKHACEDLYC